MTEKELRYGDLGIREQDLWEAMGGDGRQPDGQLLGEMLALTQDVARWLRPRFGYVVRKGVLDTAENTLDLNCGTPQRLTPMGQDRENRAGDGDAHEGKRKLDVHPIIGRQLRGAEAFALFVATAGQEYEAFQRQLTQEGDMVRVFVANALGSVIAERCADRLEETLQESIAKLGWQHTNRFSPGYCGWEVNEQQRLFALMEGEEPCGIHLTESSLMIPIKSVSGIIGVGKDVRKQAYSCGRCDFDKCYKRRQRVSR